MSTPRSPRPLAGLLAALAFASSAPVAGSEVLDRFDAAVDAGLPRTIVLPAGAERAGRGGRVDGVELSIHAPLDVEVRFPNGDDATMFVGAWQGEAAVITRSAGHMDITVKRSDGVEITGFSGDSEQSHRVVSPGDADTLGAPRHDAPLTTHARRERSATSSEPSVPERPPAPPTLTFWLFLHDDTIRTSRQHIHAGYVAWWLEDMKRVLPGYRLRSFYVDNRPGMTDVPYGNTASMWRWTFAAQQYARGGKLHHEPGRFEHKFMLVTRDRVRERTTGLAWLGGDQAMASLAGSYNVIAHEFGHTLGAIHDDAAVWWRYVWPCETNMYPTTAILLSNCYRYTEASERRIRDYLKHAADGPGALDPSANALPLVE